MVVFIHSFGSLWQEQILPAGGVRIWNTTGIRSGGHVRSCAKSFGQVKFGARARTELSGSRTITGAAWTASELVDSGNARKLALLCRAPGAAVADFYLVTVTDALVGELQMDSWDASRSVLVSFSEWRTKQEVMLLMQPYGWLRGSNGSAVLVESAGKCDWNVTRW